MDKKIGVFGGSFDPPHIAHKIAAEFAMDYLELDKIVFVPTGNHPLKNSANTLQRFEMSKLAFGNVSGFEVSDIEINKSAEKTYTIDTLEDMARSSTDKLFLLIGADNFLSLNKWKEPERLFDLAQVAVMLRPDFDISSGSSEFADRIIRVPVPLMEISSSMIRQRVGAGKSIRFLVDESVDTYIAGNRLYKLT